MKKFIEFIKESNDSEIMPHDIKDFEYVATYMNDKEREKYMKALDLFWTAYNAKEIYNARFGETYSYDLSRPLERAYSKVRDIYMEKMRENKFADDSDSIFSIISIKKMERHFKKHEEKYPELYRFLYSIRKLPDFIKTLKTYIKKGKEPKPIDPNAFVKPMIPYEAKKKAIEFLDSSVNAIRNQYYESMENSLQLVKIKLIKGVEAINYESNKFFQYDSPFSMEMKLMGQKIFDFNSNAPMPFRNKMTLVKNVDQIIRKMAHDQVDEIIMNFISKNSEKLGHIFAKKASIRIHKILENKVVGRNLENTMYFEFSDNSKFTVYTSTVYGYSNQGAFFVKYPTRFTNVFFADGSKMSMPSEEKMIKDF